MSLCLTVFFGPLDHFFRKFLLLTTGARYGSALPCYLSLCGSVGNRFLGSSTNRFLSKQTGFLTYEFVFNGLFRPTGPFFSEVFVANDRRAIRLCAALLFVAMWKCRESLFRVQHKPVSFKANRFSYL